MNYRRVIAEAWIFTRENKKLMWWYAFLPSLLTTLVGILYLLYQFFAFKRSQLFENAEHGFLYELTTMVLNFFTKHGNLLLPTIIIAVTIVVLYLLLPTFAQGGLVQIIARKRKNEPVKISDGISLGLLVFLPLFEYHLIIRAFSFITLLTQAAFVLRNLGPQVLQTLLPVYIIFAIVIFFITLFFTYTDFFIILERKPILKAMGNSARLVVIAWQHTFLVGILMLIIGLRIILNVVAALLIPALLFLAVGLLATFALKAIGFIVGGIIGLIALFITAYFSGILNIFADAVWTFTFLELTHDEKTKELMGNEKTP